MTALRTGWLWLMPGVLALGAVVIETHASPLVSIAAGIYGFCCTMFGIFWERHK